MSWGISENATEKEKIFADFSEILNGINSADGLSYNQYSCIYDIGRELADKEYQQGRADAIEEFCSEIDLEEPMHFTKEQVRWIKKYVILKRWNVIDECIEIIKGISRRNFSYRLDEIVNRTVEQMENLKEWKNE